MKRRLGILPALLCISLTSGCLNSMSPAGGLLSRLDGRGPVALSADNPYLVGNLVLAREVAKSPVLKGFISHRGTPSAVEVKTASFGSYKLLLFYLPEREQFIFEELSSKWIVDGPKPIPAEILSLVTTIAQPGRANAQLLSGRALSQVLGETIPQNTTSPESQPKQTPPPAPALPPPTPRLTIAPADSRSATQGAATAPPMSDEGIVALLNSKGAPAAEISPKGDLVHYVTLSGETLSLISRWYTLDFRNAGRLARINGIKEPGMVSIGDIVVVPSYLVRNKSRLTQEAIELLVNVTPTNATSASTPGGVESKE
ncbi:MAG: hypothetical protein EBZ48_03930 [Proteobacteria bacterium]|nr:hypothetical protein [Pseudomonadota bacterium]